MEDSCAVMGYVLSQRPGFSKGIAKDFDEDPLQYCLSMVIADPDEKYQHNRSLIFRYLSDYFQKATKEQRARVDEPLAMLYYDWATLHEIDKMISRHGQHEVSPQYLQENGSKDADINPEDWDSIEMGLYHAEALRDFSKLPLPSERKDEAWITCDMNSRNALSKMWKGAQEFFRATLKCSGVNNKEMEEINAIFPDIDAEHMANITLTHDTIRARIELDLQARNKRVSKVGAGLQIAWGIEDSSTFQATHKKEKTKTRTIASTQADDPVQAVPDISVIEEVDTTTTELQIKVDIKTLGVFTSMYSDPDGGQDTSTVSWKDFRRGMHKAGFESWEGRGSAVEFQPAAHLDWGDSKKIGCHRPHPDPHFDFIQLRGLGRRLGKHLGLNRNTFVLNE
ncbi:hypothetical protein BOTCAL_0455g00010 [Botryotinia calthae]|uniref:Uncharacterized protein n=1 Tax=Botryotinia calthae TaxID=38488 RepID=A0A4Y8CNM8_9HELO|nr:hypothetical protein BOTCAL_0455g00010 [Botryotinia calthae]